MENLKFFLRLLIIVFIIYPSFFVAQNVRPIRDNIGYCWTPVDMNRLIDFIEQKYSHDEKMLSDNLIAGISPHDDYLFAADVCYPLFSSIKTQEVVIFGVTHGTVRSAIGDPKEIIILDSFDEWIGPYGPIEISPLREKIKSDLDINYFSVNDKAHKIEHSIEGMIPFLQYFNRNVKITPIMVTAMSYERSQSISNQLAKIITKYIWENNLEMGKDIFFLISNDANHYGPDFENSPYGTDIDAHEKATEKDVRIAAGFLDGKITITKIKDLTLRIWDSTESEKPVPLWCGRYPIVLGLSTVSKVVDTESDNSLQGRLIKYSDTFSSGVLPLKGTKMGITAPFSLEHWVGYFSAAFYQTEVNN